MKIRSLFGLLIMLAFCTGCQASASKQNPGNSDSGVAGDSLSRSTGQTVSKAKEPYNVPSGVKALLEAYPDFISGWNGHDVIFRDGSKIIYDDGKKKSFEQRLDDSDIEDMFADIYKDHSGAPEYLADAGRSRSEALFKKMYGNSDGAVRKNLTRVDWFGEKVQFTRVNGAADSLRQVAAELARNPELRKYLKSSGTFYWRKVRGANRQSAHSYGIAFDIGVAYSDYWKWKNPKAGETTKIKYANRIPKQIVDIFRRHGFIWGGNWYHYDTMHFEFRPELLSYAKNNTEASTNEYSE